MGAMEEMLVLAQRYATDEEQRRALECEVSFHDFVREFFPVIEPATTYLDNWHIECICEHLAACSAGEITRIIFNIPPRHAKSIIVSVMWNAWEWISKPSLRYLHASYAESLSLRDSAKTTSIITSPKYQKWYGSRFTLTKQQAKVFWNDKAGYRLANSVGGSNTGEGGERIICFPYDQKILTESGVKRIGDVVKQRLTVRVHSMNQDTQEVELREVSGWHTNSSSKLVRVVTESGSFVCTPNHEIMSDTGWMKAKDLASHLVASIDNRQPFGSPTPRTPAPDMAYGRRFYSIFSGKNLARFFGLKNIYRILSGQFNPRFIRSRIPVMVNAVFDVLLPCAIREIGRTIVKWVSIQVSNVVTSRSRAVESGGDQNMRFDVKGLSVDTQYCSRVSVRKAEFKNTAVNREQTVASNSSARQAAYPAESGSLVTKKLRNRVPKFIRIISVEDAGFAGETFCITVAHNHSFFVVTENNSISCDSQYVLVSNCDDPHNSKERNSDAMRGGVLDWYDNVMSSRFNDPKTSVMAVIMQRVHHQDLTGHLLSKGTFTHVMLPAEFEIGRRCSTNWYTDPRKEEGELLWPDRFGRKEVDELKRDLGTYGAAGQLQQRPSPEGGGMIELDWFKRYSTPPARLRRTTFSVDCANKAKSSSAWNVIEVWGEDMDGIDCLLKVIRFRAEYPELRRNVVSHYLKWSPEAVLIEDKANGIALLQDLANADTRKQIAQQLGIDTVGRIPLIAIEPEGDKIGRMSIESPHIEAGGCALPMFADWLPEFELEITSFPNSEYMDQIDTLSQYLMWKRSQQKRVGVQLARVVGA